VLSIIQVAFEFSKPHRMSHMFWSWLWGIRKEEKQLALLLLGATDRYGFIEIVWYLIKKHDTSSFHVVFKDCL
jgi:hypothetical protein